jgi:hypothetical protein
MKLRVNMQKKSKNFDLPITGLNSGVYFLKVVKGNDVAIQQLVIL